MEALRKESGSEPAWKSGIENTLFEGDCLELMPLIPDRSVHLILCDLPYGTTQNRWDSVIDLARLCNFPGKIDADGAQVVDMWLDRDIRSIVEYNQIDTLNTYLIWLRLINFCGKVTEEEYYAEQEDFHEFLTKLANDTENGHIRRFLAKWQIH